MRTETSTAIGVAFNFELEPASPALDGEDVLASAVRVIELDTVVVITAVDVGITNDVYTSVKAVSAVIVA